MPNGPCCLQDAHKKTLVLDLDETLVHSSFKPIPDPDYIIPVEIEGKVCGATGHLLASPSALMACASANNAAGRVSQTSLDILAFRLPCCHPRRGAWQTHSGECFGVNS